MIIIIIITSSTGSIVVLFGACVSLYYDAILTTNARANGPGKRLAAVILGPPFSNK